MSHQLLVSAALFLFHTFVIFMYNVSVCGQLFGNVFVRVSVFSFTIQHVYYIFIYKIHMKYGCMNSYNENGMMP